MDATSISPPPATAATGNDAAADGSTAGASFQVGLLGAARITWRDQTIAFRSQKARALFLYLALAPDRTARRSQLCGLLWGDSPEANARTSLRQTVFALRSALQPHGIQGLVGDGDTLALVPPDVQVDVDELVRELAQGRIPPQLVAGAWRFDDVLAELEGVGDAFREWVVAVRTQMKERVERALALMIDDAGLAEDRRRLAAEAALTVDPANERACRCLMRIAAATGRTGDALRVYNALYHRLDAEFDVEPAPETQELAAAIKLGRVEPATKVAPAATAAAPRLAPRVAVLPIRLVGEAEALAGFAQGLVEETVTSLSRVREPVVISTNSSRGLGGEASPSHARRELGADYVVVGTMRPSPGGHRLTMELCDAVEHSVLWSRPYEVTPENLERTQVDLATAIAQTTVPSLRASELRRSWQRQPEDMSVYQLLLRARELICALDRTSLDTAFGLLQRAVTLEPFYAPVYAGLADLWSIRIGQGWSIDRVGDTAALERSALRAVDLESDSGRALAILGHNRTILKRAYDEALRLFDQAERAMPNDAETLMWTSPTFTFLGETDEAIRRAERALALSPQDPCGFRYEAFLSIAYYAAGRYDEAVHWGERSMARNPNYTSNLRNTAASLVAAGRPDDARRIARALLQVEPEFRVDPFVPTVGYRDPAMRATYGERLIAAGLPR